MTKKILFCASIIIIFLFIIMKGCDYKLQHDKEQILFNQQKEEITLYLKYNTINFKNVTFTKTYIDPMGVFVVEGYINNNKNLSFNAATDVPNTTTFEGDIGGTESFMHSFKKGIKDIPEIKKDIREQKSKNFGLQ